ncbi:MAG: beta-galactosidase, partial [Bacteroidales bacterium]|nr:beta-galactosidase [Bacteroidales bacterium]
MNDNLVICRFACTLALLLIVSSLQGQSQKDRHTFTLGTEEFLLDGKPFQIISGEIHPGRVPAEYWRHRIQMAKAMGCNTISAYLFWNHHESEEGIYDFRTDNRDISRFITTAAEEGMWVIIRPGP